MNNLFERASGRAAAVALAVVLALVATFSVNEYVRSREQALVAENELVEAWQFVTALEAGVAGSELLTSDGEPDPQRLQLVRTSRESLPFGAVGDPSQLKGQYLLQAVAANQFLASTQFGQKQPTPAFLLEVPPGQVAVSFDVDVTAGVANFLDPGDRITILANIGGAVAADGGVPDQDEATRIVLQNVRILAVGVRVPGARAEDGGEVVRRDEDLLTLTVAVDALDAERLVFAASTGTVHVALQPDEVGDFVPATTPGRNAGNLFER